MAKTTNKQADSDLGKNKTVFIVEDDISLVKDYQWKLGQEGIDVWVTGDGQEAVSFLDRQPPNVVVLDIMLPGMSGFEILETIRKNEKWKNVPVIMLSNLGQSQDIEKSKTLGAQEYIVKAETHIKDVIGTIKKYL